MKYKVFVCLIMSVVIFSCKNDDDLEVIAVEASLLSEVSPEDDAEIREFLQTHFYNYEEFETPPTDFDYKITIDTIAGENAGKRPLIDDAEAITITNVDSEDFGLDAGEENISHTYYIIKARVREKASPTDPDLPTPTIADSVLLKYQGTLLDGTLFDENQTFSWQHLPFFLRGYAHGISQLPPGTEDQIIDNGDGTIAIDNSSIAMLVLPSGLAYFSNPRSSDIPSYSPLIFNVEIGMYIEDTDADNDGVPSILEDVNGDGKLDNDNTDEEDEANGFAGLFPNYLDADDDGDGVSTNEEITDDEGNIILPYPDANNDGTPDYLDPDTN